MRGFLFKKGECLSFRILFSYIYIVLNLAKMQILFNDVDACITFILR